MKRTLALIMLVSSSAFALDVPRATRTPLPSKKEIHQVLVRDPSLLKVVVTDGAVSLEGTQSGVTAITVEYADGELERTLVVVGEGTNSKGMSAEQAKTVDLKPKTKTARK